MNKKDRYVVYAIHIHTSQRHRSPYRMSSTSFLDDILFSKHGFPAFEDRTLRSFNLVPSFISPDFTYHPDHSEFADAFARQRNFDIDDLKDKSTLAQQDPSWLRQFLQEWFLLVFPAHLFNLDQVSARDVITNHATSQFIHVSNYVWQWLQDVSQKWIDTTWDIVPQKYQDKGFVLGHQFGCQQFEIVLLDWVSAAKREYIRMHCVFRTMLENGLIDVVSKDLLGGRRDGWRFIYSLQVAGEIIGHALLGVQLRFRDTLVQDEHFQRRMRAEHEMDPNTSFLEWIRFFQPINVDWESNDGLKAVIEHGNYLCPSQVGYITACAAGSNFLTWLYAALRSRRQDAWGEPPADHTRCTATACKSRDMDENTYVTRHFHEQCQCELIGPDIGKLRKIIGKGEIPLLKFEETNPARGCQITVVSHKKVRRYTAISHVWSDGLGNPRANKLPYCQIERLARLCDDSPIWMDTLCIPVRTEDEHLRKKAIEHMDDIYFKASSVYVISDDLNPKSLQDLSPWEDNTHIGLILLLVCLSAWSSRLWTLQEAVFGMERLYVCFDEDERFNLHDAIFAIPSSQKYLYNFFHMTLMETIRTQRTTKKGKETGEGLYSIFSQLRWRRTSWARDEPVVVAGILGLNTSLLMKTPNNIEQRLEVMYSQLREFPIDALFCHTPRLNKEGLCWAPKKLCMSDWCTDSYLLNSHKRLWWEEWSGRTGNIGRDGLQIQAYSITFTTRDPWLPAVFTLKCPRKSGELNFLVTIRGLQSTDTKFLEDYPSSEDKYHIVIIINRRKARGCSCQPESYGQAALTVWDSEVRFSLPKENRIDRMVNKVRTELDGPDDEDTAPRFVRLVCSLGVTRGTAAQVDSHHSSRSFKARMHSHRPFIVD